MSQPTGVMAIDYWDTPTNPGAKFPVPGLDSNASNIWLSY